MESISVAFVGAGYMTREHAAAFKDIDIDGVVLAGITSRTESKAAQLALELGIKHVCGTIDELYEKTHADLLVVSVPELSANDVLSKAITYPWVILAEKPVGYCLQDAEDIQRKVKDSGRDVFVGLNRRFYHSTTTALMDLSHYDSPRFTEVFDQQDAAGALEAGQPELVVRNWMYANSIHLVDYITAFCRGDVTKVEQIIPWNPAMPGNVVAIVHFSSGDIAYYHAVWNGPGPWACFVTTPEKRWELRPLEKAQFQRRNERKLIEVDQIPAEVNFKAGLRNQADEAVKAASGNPSNLVSLAEAMKSMRLVHDIYGC